MNFSPVMMAKRPDVDTMDSICAQHRRRKIIKKSTRHTDCTSITRVDIRRTETTLSPDDELECRQMYEKLQRLQPNGVCVDINTLRRALYPPSPLPKNINDQILAFKTYRQRSDEIPQIRTSHTPKQKKLNKIEPINLDRIINQVHKHAAINYSYYTRTK